MCLKYFKKLSVLALLGIALLGALPAQAAGTLPIALAQQIDVNGQPLAGCIVNFFVAGTVASPQNSYSDFGLTQNPNNVLQCDQSGRVPMFWLADGLIHVRLTDATGVAVIDTTMQVLGPSSGGGGGGGTVDPTTIYATGDLKVRYGTGPLSGFVRTNALTIGNATSGATERANADTQALFIHLYNTDPNLVVSGGRTGNALNDYNANKTIATPDWRGKAIAALADMGNSASSVLTQSLAGCTLPATTLGSFCGSQTETLTLAQLPTNITSSASPTITVTGPNGHTLFADGGAPSTSTTPGGGFTFNTLNSTTAGVFGSGFQFIGVNTVNSTSNNTLGQAHTTVQPTVLATIYLKL